MQLFQRQYRIIGSFSCTLKNIAEKGADLIRRAARATEPAISDKAA